MNVHLFSFWLGSDCSSEILRRGPSGRGTPCPFCRHNPFEVRVVASDSEDEQLEFKRMMR